MTPPNHFLEHSHCYDNVLLNCVFSSKTNLHLVLSRLRSWIEATILTNIIISESYLKHDVYFFYWLIDCISFRIPFENISLTFGRLQFDEGLHSLGLFSGLTVFEQEGIESLSCHICYDTGPRFIRSHPKDLFSLDTQGASYFDWLLKS